MSWPADCNKKHGSARRGSKTSTYSTALDTMLAQAFKEGQKQAKPKCPKCGNETENENFEPRWWACKKCEYEWVVDQAKELE